MDLKILLLNNPCHISQGPTRLDQTHYKVVWNTFVEIYIYMFFHMLLFTALIFMNSNELVPSIPERQLFQNVTLKIQG